MFALVVALAIAVVLLKLQPFVSDSDDLVSTMAQWVLFLQVFAGLLTKIQAQQACAANDGGSFDVNALAYVLPFSPLLVMSPPTRRCPTQAVVRTAFHVGHRVAQWLFTA